MYISIVLNIGVAIYSDYMAVSTEITRIYAATGTLLGAFIVFSLYSFLNRYTFNLNNNFINRLGELTFGVYLIHFLIIKIIFNLGVHSNMINPIVGIFLVVLLVTILSYTISFVISKIPIIKKTIGM